MLPRERVLEAIAHRRTDRAPANFHAWPSVAEALIERLGLADREELLQALNVDMRRVTINYGQPSDEPDADGYVRDMWGLRVLEGSSQRVASDVIYPFDESTTVDDVHAHDWPDPAAVDCSGVRAACEAHVGRHATYGAPWSPFFHEVGWLIGQENLFLWMMTKPDVVQAIIDHVVDYEVAATRRFLEAADGMIDIAFFGNDFGTQRALVMSPEMWAQFFRGPLKRFFDVSHDYGCRVMKHSCGAVRDIIPMWIDDGVDVLDPVQVAASGMDLPGLVADFGDRLTFHGGVDTQSTLPFGTLEKVRREVRSYLDLTRERGGYILCGSQDYIDDIPLESILAIYEENAQTA